jgi:hypothetical protein
MNLVLRLAAATAVLLGLVGPAFPDVPAWSVPGGSGGGRHYRPGPPMPVHPANAVPVVIEASDTLTEPRLVIPRPLLARAKKLIAGRRSAALQDKARPAAVWRGRATALAGLALTAALSAAGLCLARRKGRVLVAALVLSVACAFGAGRTFLVAQHPPPPNLPPPPPLEVQFDHAAVEVVERGTEVRLLVPRARLGELAGKSR